MNERNEKKNRKRPSLARASFIVAKDQGFFKIPNSILKWNNS